MKENKQIAIIGAGLVGSLMGLLLRRRGFEVSIFEKRGDLRRVKVKNGRSINLALSDRGIRTLKDCGVFDDLTSELVPMKGRMMHATSGDLTFQAYGHEGQFINSVSRLNLNRRLIDIGEKEGVQYHFHHRCVDVNIGRTTVYFAHEGDEVKKEVGLVIGADGAFSDVRKSIIEKEKKEFEKTFLDYGYKELTIPAIGSGFAMEPNYLHIWPRSQFMLIALPNPDQTFTCTLFLPYEGEYSFENLQEDSDILAFFDQHFSDAKAVMPNLLDDFRRNPTSSLVTIKSFPWHSNQTLVIGDASHAIVPFYGQGMNAGFEDCRLLMEVAEAHDFNWKKVLPLFESHRKKDVDAIAELALRNFEEMKSKVRDDSFLQRKNIEARLHAEYPEDWIPLYSMVTFSHMPYSDALQIGKWQDQVFQRATDENFLHDLARMVEELNTLKKGALIVPQ